MANKIELITIYITKGSHITILKYDLARNNNFLIIVLYIHFNYE